MADPNASTYKKLMASLRGIAKYAYWILGLLLVGYAAYFLYNTLQRPVAAVLLFIGGILALYFYYIKWFVIGEKDNQWPPYQTLCPDYLTPISPGYGADGKPQAGPIKCVDFVGVSRNGRFKKMNQKNMDSLIHRDDHAFPIVKGEKREDLRTRLQTYGLSWISLFGDN
jgi:hypothetical protein